MVEIKWVSDGNVLYCIGIWYAQHLRIGIERIYIGIPIKEQLLHYQIDCSSPIVENFETCVTFIRLHCLGNWVQYLAVDLK